MNKEEKDLKIALIDWLSFTIRTDSVKGTLAELELFLSKEFHISTQSWKPKAGGWNGYTNKIELGDFGFLAYGGESQKNTVHVRINGNGCSVVADWKNIHDTAVEGGWVITRVDLAHDDFESDTFDIAVATQWYRDGLFSSNGRPPKARLIDDFESGEGKTLYIGKRENGKFLRVYEKGKQLGDPNSLWVRAEVELKKKDRVVPWDVLLQPGAYLAGTYKALEFVSLTQCRLKTVRKASTISYKRMVEWLHSAAGKSINAMLQVEQGDYVMVLGKVVRDGLPARLEPYSAHVPGSVDKD
jgi:phage replication initiation protein